MQDFRYHSDPGHGWLEVTTADIKAVGLTPHDFSRWSYQQTFSGGACVANIFYLEEDCDMRTFTDAWAKMYPHNSINFVDTYSDDDSFIRTLARI